MVATVMFQPRSASLIEGQKSVPHSSMLWTVSKFTFKIGSKDTFWKVYLVSLVIEDWSQCGALAWPGPVAAGGGLAEETSQGSYLEAAG